MGVIIFIGVLLCIQLYSFFTLKGVFVLFQTSPYKYLLLVAHLVILLGILGIFVYMRRQPNRTLLLINNFLMLIALMQLVACIFFLIDDVRLGCQWLVKKIFTSHLHQFEVKQDDDNSMSRGTFLKWWGIGVGATIGTGLLIGIGNRYNYQIKRCTLRFKNLPLAFNGLKLVQISDIHSGSLHNIKAVERGIDLILKENADIIVFTGDLVNNKAEEFEPLKNIFKKLQAPMGVYSILGNHDYGDYVEWSSSDAKKKNIQTLIQHHYDINWNLLLNQNKILQKNKETIAIVGVENWSKSNFFGQHGKLDVAIKGAENVPFKILLSHDPSHWDGEINKKFKDIDLTLSGHTHGMQFGINISGFKWSPAQYIYKQWSGLYQKENQMIYVNPGFGFLGYQGRVGILPEITVFEFTI